MESQPSEGHPVLVAPDVAARGIHVRDIAHVINYDLPEAAENFIHRVGCTGRAGERGVASTLFVRGQRTELFQLERALGIRLERVSMNGSSFEKSTRGRRPGMERRHSAAGWFVCPGNSFKHRWKANFRRKIDRAFGHERTRKLIKCAIMNVARLVLFRNLSIYSRGSSSSRLRRFRFGMVDLCE
jgi:superfamily II DNA/RNA helicase